MARGCIINCHLDINGVDNASRKIVNRRQLASIAFTLNVINNNRV